MRGVLPVAQFSTLDLPPRQRYEAWRSAVSAVFEPRPADASRIDIRVRTTSVHLGTAVVVRAKAEAHHLIRTRRLIAVEDLDHYLFQVYRSGVCRGTYGTITNTVEPGDIKVVDLARPFHSINTDFDNVTLTVPRAALAPLVAHPDRLHGRVLDRRTAAARLLGSHLRQFAARGHELDPAQAAGLGAATVRLLAAALGPSPQANDETRLCRAAATAELVREFIEQHLTSPGLTPAVLAEHFRMSRAQLYRLFAGEGGIAAYVRARRLRACARAITNPMHGAERIGAVALRYGFGSEAHFSRAFRKTFGVSPREARAVPPAGEAATGDSINDWLRALR